MTPIPALATQRVADEPDLARLEASGYEAYMPFHGLGEALEAVARVHAQRTALTYLRSADPGQPARRLTYSVFIRQLRQAANLFRSLGVDDERAVAFLLPAIPAAYLTLLGGAMAGRVCPINYLLSRDHIVELLQASNSRVVVALAPAPGLALAVTEDFLRERCPAVKHVLWVHEDELVAGGFEDRVAREAGDRLLFERDVQRDTVAAYFHTGGTTGAPKLAMHTHGNQLHAAWSAAQLYATTERDVIINGFPLFHVAGAFVFGLSTLLAGGTVVLPTLLGMRNTAFVSRYWTFVERERATLLGAVPTVIAALLGVEVGDAKVGSVRALLTGGSPLPDELAAAFEKRLGVPVRNILGMTECAGVISIEPFAAPRVSGSCGLRLPFTQVRAIADAPGPFDLLAAGETGILAVRGPNVGPGYTDQANNPGTFTDDGWLVTGDIGHVDADGRIFISGRAKDVIIRSSHNIDPRIIEDALMAHPDVAFAAAVGEPDEYAGELPVAFVALRPGAPRDAEGLLAFAQPLIPERPAYPKRLTFIDTMPMTAIGKVYKPALRLLAFEQAFQERLLQRGLHDRVHLSAREERKAIVLDFAVAREADPRCHEEVRTMMASFAIRYTLA